MDAMKRDIAPLVTAAGALTVLAALSQSIAPHVGLSQRGFLIVVLCGYVALFFALLAITRRRRHGG